MSKVILTKKEFKEVMQIVNRAAKDEVRPILQGICFNNNDVIAIDGYRLSIRKLPTSMDGSCVIHQNDLKNILKFVKREVENIEIDFDLEYATFKLFNKSNELINEFKAEYLYGNYINYKNLLLDDDKINGVIRIDSKELLNIIKPLKKYENIYIKLEEDVMEIFTFIETVVVPCGDGNISKCRLKFIGKLEVKNLVEKDLMFGFNSTYLKEALKDYDEFKLSYVDKLSPFIIEDLEGKNKYDMVLPLRFPNECELVY